MATDYTKLLLTGRDNSISATELCAVLGFSDVRSLRADISKSRLAGQIILTNSETGGYYRPSNKQEVEEFVHSFQKQAISILRILKSARQYLSDDPDQLSLDDVVQDILEDEK